MLRTRLRPALKPETCNVFPLKCGRFASENLSKIAHLPSSNRSCSGFGSVVWTTDTGTVGVRGLTTGFGGSIHAMPDSENDRKSELERLRLASDFRQLAKETLDPDLKEHWLRMARQWSGEVEEPTQDDTEIDETGIDDTGVDKD
jgi:hypothetical protein